MAFSNVKPSLHYYPTVCIKNCSVVVRFAAQSSLRPFPAEASPIPSPAASNSGRATKRNIMALILEPTRELAQQTYFLKITAVIARYECLNHFKAFMTRPAVEVGLLIGGEQVSAAYQKRTIENSHIIVATPSRPYFWNSTKTAYWPA